MVLSMVVAASRYKKEIVPNYRAMFIMGLCFIPIGIANLGLLPLGIIFLIVGLRNKNQWGKETKWADFPPRLKKMKLLFAGGFIILLLLAIAFFLFWKVN